MCAASRNQLGGCDRSCGERGPGECGRPALIAPPRFFWRLFALPGAPATVESPLYVSACDHCRACSRQQPRRAARIDFLLIDFLFLVSCPHVWINQRGKLEAERSL